MTCSKKRCEDSSCGNMPETARCCVCFQMSSVSLGSAVQPTRKRILSSFLGYLGGIQCDPRDGSSSSSASDSVSRDRDPHPPQTRCRRDHRRPAATSDSVVAHLQSLNCESRRVMSPTVKERRAVVITLTSCCMSMGSGRDA
jgi:hypothetical protein